MIFFFSQMGGDLAYNDFWISCIIMRRSRGIDQPGQEQLYIRRSASASHQAIVHYVIGFQWRKLPFTCLGCLVFTWCLKISHFDDEIRKVRDRISGQANHIFSIGGKLVLIRHVLSFHVLRPPATVVQRLERLFTRFLQGDSKGRRQMHQCKWLEVCFPVDEGGLGIQSFDDIVEAFEIKLWWRLHQQSLLWASFMKSKYCRSTHPSLIQFRYPASPLQRRLYTIHYTTRHHVCWLIRSRDCSFWYDCQLNSSLLVLYNLAAASSVPVSLFWQGTVQDRGKLKDVLPLSIVEQILLVPISSREPDLICWDFAPNGNFHLQTAWELVRCSRRRDELSYII